MVLVQTPPKLYTDLVVDRPLLQKHEVSPAVHGHIQHPSDLSHDLGSQFKGPLPRQVSKLGHRLEPKLLRGKVAGLPCWEFVNDDVDIEEVSVEEWGDKGRSEEVDSVAVQHLPSTIIVCCIK